MHTCCRVNLQVQCWYCQSGGGGGGGRGGVGVLECGSVLHDLTVIRYIRHFSSGFGISFFVHFLV